MAVLLLGRARPGPLALGLALTTFGGANVVRNLLPFGATGAVVFEPVIAMSSVALCAAAALVPRPLSRGQWPALLVGLAVWALLYALVTMAERDGNIGIVRQLGFSWLGVAVFPLYPAAMAVASTRIALSPPRDRTGWLAASAIVGALGSYTILRIPAQFGDSAGSPYPLLATMTAVASIAIPFLVASARTRSRGPMLVALGTAGLGLASYSYFSASAGTVAAFFDPWGLLGVARLVGWTILVHAILRADLLGVPLPRIAVSRGTAAAGSLALLFIVAEVAQNFLSAEYGLLTGGIVAGSFLFAAQPIQRAMEQIATGKRRVEVAELRTQPGGNEEVYRKALRLALRDKRISRDEEVHLHELATALGIPAARAHTMLVEVEREVEKGPRP